MQFSDQFLQAVENYLDGHVTAEEHRVINEWYHSFDDGEVNVVTNSADYADLVENRLKNRIEESAGITGGVREKKRTISLWIRIAVAAAAIVAVILGVWQYSVYDKASADDEFVSRFKNDVVPGKNRATLILGNGEVLSLSEAKTGLVVDASSLKYSDGSKVQVSSGSPSLGPQKSGQSITGPVGDPSLYTGNSVLNGRVQTLTAVTPRGGTYQVVLPDGTRVWLNAASSLKFPSRFDSKERRVQLIGEAYFEVATAYVSLRGVSSHGAPLLSNGSGSSLRRDMTKQSFIVVTDKQEVEVLGTHFNINSYADERSVKTTLLEGSVKVTSMTGVAGKGLKASLVLKPDQQASLNAGGISMQEVDAAAAVDWKNGEFRFKNEPLPSILRKIARWYDVDIQYAASNKKVLTFSGAVSRFDKVSVLLNMLQKAGDVKFTIEGKTIKAE